jgi:hypothetical protein
MPRGHEPVGSDQSELSLGDYKGCGGFVSERCMRMMDDLGWTPSPFLVQSGHQSTPCTVTSSRPLTPDSGPTAGMAERSGAEPRRPQSPPDV